MDCILGESARIDAVHDAELHFYFSDKMHDLE